MDLLICPVLPPISTDGMTSDDVTSLAESTRQLMLDTLRSISTPSSTQKSAQIPAVSDDVADTPAEGEKESSNTQKVLQEVEIPRGEAKQPSESELSIFFHSRGEETTEDEMDDDAVLLKRPAGRDA